MAQAQAPRGMEADREQEQAFLGLGWHGGVARHRRQSQCHPRSPGLELPMGPVDAVGHAAAVPAVERRRAGLEWAQRWPGKGLELCSLRRNLQGL